MSACEYPTKSSPANGKVLTRIYIESDGNVVVTDLWEDLRTKLLNATKGFTDKDEGSDD
jgi:hypothetical protein